MNPITDLIGTVAGKVLDRVLPDPAVREEAKLELARMAQAGELAQLEHEIEQRRVEIEASRVGIEEERVHQQDRDSARRREVETGDSVTTRALAFIVMTAFLISLVIVHFFEVPQGALAIAYMLFGALIGQASQVLNYYFGSSMGSANKEKMLSRSLEHQQAGEIRRIPPRL